MAKVAKMIGATEPEVAQLLDEGRLASAIMAKLKANGVALTPKVKDSVQSLINGIEPKYQSNVAKSSDALLPQAAVESTYTIMFTDIVGHTAMMSELGDRLGRRLFSTHDDIVRRLTEEYNGSIVKAMGDGFMLTYPSANRGLACAIAIQRELDTYNRQRGTHPVLVRMGLSVGEPINDSDDLYGMPVITAARISAKADAEQIFVSQIVYALTASRGDFKFSTVGEMELKGIEGSQMVYEVAWKES